MIGWTGAGARLWLAAGHAVATLVGAAGERARAGAGAAPGAPTVTQILTSCPSCLQGLSRFGDDLQNGQLEADYIVVEMARRILGEDWLPGYVERANAGGIERVLV